ncbi:response regulator [Acidobacteriota bacterium]
MRIEREDKKVFIADSSDTYRLLVAKVLTEAGYQVSDAADGKKALENVKGMIPGLDLLILDLNLLEIKGIDVIREVRQVPEGKDLGIIVLTEFLSDHLKEILAGLGVTIYVNKLYALRDLLYQVDAFLFPHQQDARESQRKLVNVPVNYWIGDELYLNQCYDLSENGMFIVMTEEEPCPVGTRLTIRFWLPFSEKLISCDGEVVWRNKYDEEVKLTHPPGIGVKFIELKDENRFLIKEFLEKA